MLLGGVLKNPGKKMLNICNKVNLSPLMRAAMYNHVEVLDLLLKEGSDATALDNAHRTALDYARLYKHVEATAVLEKWKVMLETVVSGGKT